MSLFRPYDAVVDEPHPYGVGEEVAKWRWRSFAGPYRAASDAFTGSPPDWERVVSGKGAVMTNPEGGHLWAVENDGTLPVIPSAGVETDARNKSRELAMAALWALLRRREDPVAARAAQERVKRTLLAQTEQAYCDFHDRNLYPFGAYRDLYLFALAHAMTSQLVALDLLQAAGTPFRRSEWERLRRWHAGFAELGEQETHARVSIPFVDRASGDYTLNGWGATTGGESIGWVENPWWWRESDGAPGPETTNISNLWNNRQASHARYFSLFGLKFGAGFYVQRGVAFVKEYLAYAVFPEDGFAELHRFTESDPNAGIGYASLQYAHVATVADALRRSGDSSLLDYSTTAGAHGSEGATKSLQGVAASLAAWFAQEHDVYAVRDEVARLGDSDYKPYSRAFLKGEQNRLAIGNDYWQDATIQAASEDGACPYPSSTQPYAWDAGDAGASPAHMLMFAP